MPHIAANGHLCYFAEGSFVLDRYRPDIALDQCLAQAQSVIDMALRDPQYRDDEFRGEFWINWAIAQEPVAFRGLLGQISDDAKRVSCYAIGPAEERLYFTSSFDEVSTFCRALGWPQPVDKGGKAWLVRSSRMPAIPAGGLPATVLDMFKWTKEWDPDLARQIQEALVDRALLESAKLCAFTISTPVGVIGFSFEVDRTKALAYRRHPKHYRNYLHQPATGGNTPIRRYALSDVGASSVYRRSLTNLGRGTLAGKRIALVGCGAIGGYLAPALIRLGAGGEGGLLSLYDVDQLQPENLGRHRLGYESLFENKAIALKKTLDHEAPFAHVDANPIDALAGFPKAFDLLINATGEQAVAEAINARHVECGMKGPVLHLWVFGNGDCVQGLWVDSTKFACYRCLRHHDGAHYMQHRFPLSDKPPTRAFIGCHAFTPYAVAAPMSTAALACDFVGDWLRNDASPRFRTRYSESSNLRRIKNQNVGPLDGCPACRPHDS
jgi:hypothetical protein